jgi:hypothetical protein
VQRRRFDDVIGFDPEKARENLAKAGFGDGEGFRNCHSDD